MLRLNFSEPQSILAPEPSQQVLDELEKIIQEKMAQEAHEKQEQQAQSKKHLQQLEQQQQHQQQQQQQQQLQQQQRRVEVEVDGRAAEEMDVVVEQHRVRSPSPERDPQGNVSVRKTGVNPIKLSFYLFSQFLLLSLKVCNT